MIYLYISASLVILLLSGLAIYYSLKVKSLNAKRREAELHIQSLKNKKIEEHKKSILFLARASIQNELSSTEASIRIQGLMEILNLNRDILERYRIFGQLRQATQHIPILDEWKKLSKKDKARLEKERLAIEEQYKDFFVDGVKRLLANPEDLEQRS